MPAHERTAPVELVVEAGPAGPIPALLVGDPARAAACVIVRYGFGAQMTVQVPEALMLAEAGYAVLIPEAPHHGVRDDGRLAAIQSGTEADATSAFLDLVEAAAAESPALVDDLVRRGARADRIVALGISYGGFTTLRSVALEPRLRRIVPMLASPHFVGRTTSPDRHPQDYAEVEMLSITAADDEVVPPGPMHDFVDALCARFGPPVRWERFTVPGGHMTPQASWDAAWEHIIGWLDRRTSEG